LASAATQYSRSSSFFAEVMCTKDRPFGSWEVVIEALIHLLRYWFLSGTCVCVGA